MRIAVISDIHANLEALQKSLAVIKEHAVDEIVCLGDIVGYGANPNECLTLIRQTTPHVLLGNHDEAAVDISKTEYFNPFARVAAEWTHHELTEENTLFLQSLPYSIARHGLLFVHSSPFEPQEWHYVLSAGDAQMNFSYFSEAVCFVGHSHVPGLFCEDIWTTEFVGGKRYLMNVGSVGQPRDNDWRLSLGIIDTQAWEYKNIRSEYEVKSASEKIRKAGLPKALAERLLVGR
jgi:predicted phosphodiesterase